jgi:hypothetical protein
VYDLRRSIYACGLLLAFAGTITGGAAAAGHHGSSAMRAQARAAHYWNHRIHVWRRETWHWQRVMGVRLLHRPRRVLASRSTDRLRRLAHWWRRREHVAWKRSRHPPLLSDWLCIHRYEGAWNDSGGPYWGGLQMNLSFQQRYGGWLFRKKGTADHWTPLEQIWVAVRAWRVRGFWPWPSTARYCGLI